MTQSNQPMLEIRQVSKQFGGVPAVKEVNLSINKGEIFALLGGSGCGKTTLLRMLAGFEKPSAGAIFIDGEDISQVPPHKRPVNMMFQSYALFPHMTVAQNVAFGLKQEKNRLSKPEIAKKVFELLSLVRMQDYAERKPNQLSGGQRQRVAIARALVIEPKIIVCDEPTSALDVSVQAHILNLLQDLREKLNLTYAFISHDLAVVEHLADWVAVMYLGRLVEYGRAADIFDDPQHPYTQALSSKSVITAKWL